MASRTFITERQRRLGTELRRMRENCGLTIQEAADRLGTNRSHVTNMELARFGVSAERVRTLAALYDCPDTRYVDALASMAGDRTRGWWEGYRGSIAAVGLDLAELEYNATSLRVFVAMHVPGLLQTEQYARAVLSETVPARPVPELRRWLSHRMRRRDILDRDDPPTCTFVIHEAALRLRFGTQEIMRTQLQELVDSSRRRNVTVRVIPFSAGGFPVPGLTMTYASGAVPQLDTVQLDTATTTEFLDAQTQLSNYRALMERITKAALPVKDSREFIRTLADST
ncbi:Scr1 family TA system antitoxin-like transcriptional regulator [Streptomyces sp. NPDC101455]|uniref:Scr1 family TA system antitoxin-like transcriptional regulator n=1 Tax=Streptomyces sp. NPDC101455 TaxID=3366142 RepID=UPI00382690A7